MILLLFSCDFWCRWECSATLEQLIGAGHIPQLQNQTLIWAPGLTTADQVVLKKPEQLSLNSCWYHVESLILHIYSIHWLMIMANIVNLREWFHCWEVWAGSVCWNAIMFSSLLSGRISTLRDETGAVSMAFTWNWDTACRALLYVS